jgi:hypothetical protein
MRTIKTLLAVLATGYILMYFSEILFWARPRPGDSLGGWLGTWLVYSFTGFILISIIGHFQARSIWALFLAGAVFGWLTEGLVVQTAYEDLPLSLSFTGLAWHALISVVVGWWILRRVVQRGMNTTLYLSAAIGLGYGLWAIHWWQAPDGGVAAIPDFMMYSLMPTLLLVAAYWIVDRLLPEPFIPNRWVVLAATVLLAIYFIIVTVPVTGLASAILPLLLLVILLTLRHNRQVEERDDPVEVSPKPHPGWSYLNLLAIPGIAGIVYALATGLELRWNTNWVLYLITTPAGFILFFLSLWKIWQKRGGLNHKVHKG